jgi:hypothetical protein
MIKTIYECDRCGHTQNDEKQMWWVEVTCYPHGGSAQYNARKSQKLWCRACADRYQLVTTPFPSEPNAPPLVTFEEQIRAIVREEMEAT